MTTITPTVEMYLSAAWADVSADVLDGLTIRRGIFGSTPSDRVARTGTFSFQLDNSAANSGAKLGYYSPDNSNLRTGFGIGTLVRIKFTDGTNTRYKFYGTITSIQPVPGQYRERRVSVTVSDYINYLATRKIGLQDVQLNKRADELITTIIGTLDTAPVATSYATAPKMFASSFDRERDEATTVLTILQKICQSDLGYFFVKGDASNGETLTYESRHTRLARTSSATLSNTMNVLDLDRDIGGISNVIKMTSHPRKVGTTTEVIYTLQKEIVLSPSAAITQDYKYTDPDVRNQRISATGIVALVAGTDYKFSTLSADDFASASGDINGSLTISAATYGANTAQITFTNGSATQTGYLWFQIRADNVIRMYDDQIATASDSTSITNYGYRELTYDLPYEEDYNTASDFANALLARYKNPYTDVKAVGFAANTNSTLAGHAILRDIGDRVTITETVTGLSSKDFFINGVEYEYRQKNLRCKWSLEPAAFFDANTFILDDATYGKLDTGVLGY